MKIICEQWTIPKTLNGEKKVIIGALTWWLWSRTQLLDGIRLSVTWCETTQPNICNSVYKLDFIVRRYIVVTYQLCFVLIIWKMFLQLINYDEKGFTIKVVISIIQGTLSLYITWGVLPFNENAHKNTQVLTPD